MKFLSLILILIFLNSCKSDYPQFDNFYYSTGDCFGTCPTYYLEISKNRSFKLFVESVYLKELDEDYNYTFDSTKIGYFKGTISALQLSELNEKIRILNSGNYVYESDQLITDLPRISLLLQRGGDRTCYSTSVPTIDFKKDFIDFLKDICEQEKLIRTDMFNVHYKHGCESQEFAKDYISNISK